MSAAIGFDNQKYIRLQSEEIKKRIDKFGGKLYLEFGGKLFDDYHASRLLPGFAPDSKIQMLKKLSDRAEIVIVIKAADIEHKMRRDIGITYDTDFVQDLHLTSFDVMNIIGVIETRYDVEIPTRDAWKLITVKDALEYMEKKGLMV